MQIQNMSMLTLVFVILLTAWIISAAIILNQVIFGKDVLEQLGKTKVILRYANL